MAKILRIERCGQCKYRYEWGQDTQTTSSYHVCGHKNRKKAKKMPHWGYGNKNGEILEDCPLDDEFADCDICHLMTGL
jgi:hypothetical protein